MHVTVPLCTEQSYAVRYYGRVSSCCQSLSVASKSKPTCIHVIAHNGVIDHFRIGGGRACNSQNFPHALNVTSTEA